MTTGADVVSGMRVNSRFNGAAPARARNATDSRSSMPRLAHASTGPRPRGRGMRTQLSKLLRQRAYELQRGRARAGAECCSETA